ncbi:CDP-alcohol phosphatidyltransferase family protein [bacterium]|nr:CDP-alcohol phosphatidyltransferase family protein [bacterium]
MKVTHVWIDATHIFAFKKLWGMTLMERVIRQVLESGIHHITVAASPDASQMLRPDFQKRYSHANVQWIDHLKNIPSEVVASEQLILLLEGHCVYDERLTDKFCRATVPAIAFDSGENYPLIAVVKAAEAKTFQHLLKPDQLRADLTKINVREMDSYYRRLRSYQPVYWIAVTCDDDLELADEYLKRSVHKGTNDLIAKFIHPPFEFALTRWICHTGIQPNHVTVFNIFLAFGAIPFFYTGHFAIALAMALTKGVTDGVDGKLARLTLRTTNFGDKLDHVSDTIYLNCYYIAMALYFSGGNTQTLPFLAMYWVIPTYFLDRVVRWLFMKRHHETVQDYRKIDVWFRLVQSNRNISMWTLLLCTLAGHPLWGFYGIIFWTPSNFVYYGCRYIYEFNRTRQGTGYLAAS